MNDSISGCPRPAFVPRGMTEFELENCVLNASGAHPYARLRQCWREIDARRGTAGLTESGAWELQWFTARAPQLLAELVSRYGPLDKAAALRAEIDAFEERLIRTAASERLSCGMVSAGTIAAFGCLPAARRTAVLEQILTALPNEKLIAEI